jgi:hypothetical protein
VNIKWRDLDVGISFQTDFPISGFCHIEITCDSQLPITETGYKSHFTPLNTLDRYDDVEAFVAAWLEYESTNSEWIQYSAERKQMDLF